MTMIRNDPPPILYWISNSGSSYEEVFGNGSIDLCKWDGTNHRIMWNFLTGKEDEYLQASGDNFYINHNAIPGGLVIRTPEGDTPVPIGDIVFKTGNGLVGVFTLTTPPETMQLDSCFTEFRQDPDPIQLTFNLDDMDPEKLN